MLLFRRNTQLYPLALLCKDLIFKHSKSAISLFYFSTESLASVYKYRKQGKKNLDITNARVQVEMSGKSLFILGSGPSVNRFTTEEWERIRLNDSWGFNLWFCHSFVPTAYLTQAVVEPEKNRRASMGYNINVILKQMAEDRKEDYKETDFFFRGDAVNKQKFYGTEFGGSLERIIGRSGYLLAEMPISSTNKIHPDILLERMFSRGFYRANAEIQAIPKFGSTVTEMISLALMLGYKEIILCGIDMNDGGHFYDHEEFFVKYPYLRELSAINNNRTPRGEHEHMDKSVRPFTIKEYIVSLRRFAKQKFGAEIYVMSEKSALFPEIQKYRNHV